MDCLGMKQKGTLRSGPVEKHCVDWLRTLPCFGDGLGGASSRDLTRAVQTRHVVKGTDVLGNVPAVSYKVPALELVMIGKVLLYLILARIKVPWGD